MSDDQRKRIDQHGETLSKQQTRLDWHDERLTNIHDQQTGLRQEMDDRFDKTDRKFETVLEKISNGNEKIYTELRNQAKESRPDSGKIASWVAVALTLGTMAYFAIVNPIHNETDLLRLRLAEIGAKAVKHADEERADMRRVLDALAGHDKRIDRTQYQVDRHEERGRDHARD